MYSQVPAACAEECDFEGCAMAQPQEEPVDHSPLATFLLSGSRGQHLVFTGLDGASPHLAYLTSTVHFSISAGHSLERAGGPMQVGQDGRVYVAVKYPSISELWPEIYNNKSIRVVQVDVYVTVRSGHETIRHPGTDQKVTYRRARTPADDVVLWRPQDKVNTIRRP